MATNQSSAPKEFDVDLSRQLGDGWVTKKAGNIVQGKLLGKFSLEGDNGPRTIYQVELEREVAGTSGKDDEQKDVILTVGQIANVDGSKALEELYNLCGNGGVYRIWFAYKDKIKVGKGSFWPVEGPKLKIVKAPAKVDIPF